MHTIILIIVLMFNVMIISFNWHNSIMLGKLLPSIIYTIQLFSFVYLMYQIF